MAEKLINDIVKILLDGITIKITKDLHEPYIKLIYYGYANYHNGIVSKNWKTSYWIPE